MAAESDKMQPKRTLPEPPVNYDSTEDSVIRTSQVTSNADDTARSFAGLPVRFEIERTVCLQMHFSLVYQFHNMPRVY